MNNLNSILLEGNLTRDPELKQTANGVNYCQLTIATNRYFKHNDEYQEEVSYFDVVSYAKLAENCAEYLQKGRGVRVVGRLRQSRWKSEDGQTRSRVMVVAEHVEFKPKPRRENEMTEQSIAAGAETQTVPF